MKGQNDSFQSRLFARYEEAFIRIGTDFLVCCMQEEDNWHYDIKRLGEGRIHPAKLITHRLPLEDLEKGFLVMRDKTEDYVKVIALEG